MGKLLETARKERRALEKDFNDVRLILTIRIRIEGFLY